MIVDCHTHVWDSPGQLGRLANLQGRRAVMSSASSEVATAPDAGTAVHLAASRHVDASIVLGFKSLYLGAEISNEAVSAYVRTHPDRLVGFAGIDPTTPAAALAEIDRAAGELGLKGIAISPAAQNLHPCSSTAQIVYDRAQERGMPVLFHPGIQVAKESVLAYAEPVLLDEVARDYASLKIIIAQLGYPWVKETLILLAKHENVYADISWLLHQPLEAYQALLSAHQYGVTDKLLFGSGFPYNHPAQSIEALYGINHICAGTNLPKIPRESLRGIVERNALELLGIPHRPAAKTEAPGADVVGDEADFG